MKRIRTDIQDVISKLFGIKQPVEVTRTSSDAFGDYATNVAMQLTKQLSKNPREIAEAIVAKLRENDYYDKVEIAGPGFINMTVSGANLAEGLHFDWKDKYGENNSGRKQTVIVEYPSPNMAKPYSIGHLRPANQGWAAKRLMEVTGWNVVTDNHLGDYGAPFGVWVVGYLTYSSPKQLAKDGVYELGRVYMETRKDLKEESARGEHKINDEVQGWLLKLEQGDEEAVEYSKKFNEISLNHIHKVMDRLKISTQYELGEAFFAPKGKEIVADLLEKGIATKNDDGSVIVGLEEYGIDTPILVQKSNGAALYATTDLATILYRKKRWQPDKVIYAVGSEQMFHFQQLFALAKKLGIETDFVHLWFGVIDQMNEDGTREKMSSRKGVVLLEELLDRAEEKAREMVKDRTVSEKDIKKIALGAIKFSDFMSDRRTNILFDWDSIFALSGFSGPYVQYAAVRVNKILRSNPIPSLKFTPVSDYNYDAEKDVIKKVLDYPAVIKMAARDLEPHKIASYLYELAKVMNKYYEDTPVATGDVSEIEKQARLWLIKKVSHVFKHGLSVLGIEVPSQM